MDFSVFGSWRFGQDIYAIALAIYAGFVIHMFSYFVDLLITWNKYLQSIVNTGADAMYVIPFQIPFQIRQADPVAKYLEEATFTSHNIIIPVPVP